MSFLWSQFRSLGRAGRALRTPSQVCEREAGNWSGLTKRTSQAEAEPLGDSLSACSCWATRRNSKSKLLANLTQQISFFGKQTYNNTLLKENIMGNSV